jgi:hypothetical protein
MGQLRRWRSQVNNMRITDPITESRRPEKLMTLFDL